MRKYTFIGIVSSLLLVCLTASGDEPVTRGANQPFVGVWRILTRRVDLDRGGHGVGDSTSAGTTRLELKHDGSWTFGQSHGTWEVAAITPADWKGWKTNSYGPKRKIVLKGWNASVGTGPIEERANGVVDFVWLIYHVEKPEPALMQIKFGHAS